MINLKKHLKTSLLKILIIAGFIFIVLCYVLGYRIRIENVRADIGVKSPNGEYRLVELSDPTGRYVLYSVVQVGEGHEAKTLFVASDCWLLSKYIAEAGWVNGTNDFYIYNTDIGTLTYRFANGTWNLEY